LPWLAEGICAVIGLAALLLCGVIWRDRRPRISPGVSFLGPRTWRAVVRSCVGWTALVPLSAAAAAHYLAADVIAFFAGQAAVAIAAIGMTIWFFNRPSFAVPPAYRTLPGFYEEWQLGLVGRSAVDEWQRAHEEGDEGS
jgi:hypothetical protein